MRLAIIAENEIYRRTLSEALSVLAVDVRTYAHDNLDEMDNCDVALCIISEETKPLAIKISKTKECFAVLEEDVTNSSSLKEEFLNVFSAPVRFGVLVEAISGYLRQRKQRELLQPISFVGFLLTPRINELKKEQGGLSVKLTEKEQDILLYLHSCEGRAVSRQNLLDHVWGYAEGVETHTLETHIYRLRQKIEEDPASPKILVTDNEGYYLNF